MEFFAYIIDHGCVDYFAPSRILQDRGHQFWCLKIPLVLYVPIFYYAATLYSRIDSLTNGRTYIFGTLYPSLSEMGLFPELLLAVAGDSDSCRDIENIPRSKVTNRTMLELTIQFCTEILRVPILHYTGDGYLHCLEVVDLLNLYVRVLYVFQQS